MKKFISGVFHIFLLTVFVNCSNSHHLELVKSNNKSRGVQIIEHADKEVLPLFPEYHSWSHQNEANVKEKVIVDSIPKVIAHNNNLFPESISSSKKITSSEFPGDDQPKEKRKYNKAAVNSFFLSLGSILVFYVLTIIIFLAIGVNGLAALLIFSVLPPAIMDAVALHLGIKGYLQIVANKEKGRFFAIAGMILGAILLALFLYLTVIFAAEWLTF